MIDLPTSASIIAVVISSGTFLSQRLTEHALARKLAKLNADHATALESTKAEHAKELVEFKARLDHDAHEQSTMFSQMVERRTDAISSLHELFVRVESVGEALLDPQGSLERARSFDEPAYEALRALKSCFERSRILLPCELCEIAEFYINALHQPIKIATLYLADRTNNEQDLHENRLARIEGWKKFRAAIVEWRPLLDLEMRKLLGAESRATAVSVRKKGDVSRA